MIKNCQMLSVLMGIAIFQATPSLAQAIRPPANPNQQQTGATDIATSDAVDTIRKDYSAHFSDLPPSRKCTPDDAKGVWKETAIYETGEMLANEQKNQGPRYLVFGAEYNQVIWARRKNPVNPARIIARTKNSKAQYIMTTGGMLYLYHSGILQQSLICSVSTAKSKKFEKNMLMLAYPVEKDKSFAISLYEKLK